MLILSRAPRHLRNHPIAVACIALSLWTVAAAEVPPSQFGQKVRTFHSVTEFRQATRGKVHIARDSNVQLELRLRRLPFPLPISAHFTVIADESPTITWIGSSQGAARVHTDNRAVEFFAGERWLPDDRVTGIGFDDRRDVDRTPKGYRAYRVHADDARREVPGLRRTDPGAAQPLGIDGELGIARAGRPRHQSSVFRPTTTDCGRRCTWRPNASAIRSRARPMPAKTRGGECRRSSGSNASPASPGFPGTLVHQDRRGRATTDGEWHDTPDNAWRWKGDTSSDEIVGHYFVYPI